MCRPIALKFNWWSFVSKNRITFFYFWCIFTINTCIFTDWTKIFQSLFTNHVMSLMLSERFIMVLTHACSMSNKSLWCLPKYSYVILIADIYCCHHSCWSIDKNQFLVSYTYFRSRFRRNKLYSKMSLKCLFVKVSPLKEPAISNLWHTFLYCTCISWILFGGGMP